MFSGTIFAIWPFANGWMLLWGLTAAAPILIHLWNKRKYREVTWAAMEFLLAAVRRHAQRIRMEQLLLLLIRTAILLLLALALADPVLSLFPDGAPGRSGQGQTHLVLVLDGSYSMDYRDKEERRFDLAKRVATQWVRRAKQGDGFTLLLMGDQPQRIIAEPAFDANEVVREINGLRLPHGGANLTTALADVEEIVCQAEKKHPRLKNHFVCFISDLDENTWQAASESGTRQRIARLAESAKLILADVGQGDRSNMTISRAEIRQSLVIAQRDVQIDADILNPGSRDFSDRRVEFFADGRLIHDETTSLAAGQQKTIAVTHRFETAGDHRIHVRLDRDSLEIDDDRWLSVSVRRSISVLCIEGKHGAAHQIALALQPEAESTIRTEVVPESALLERELSNYDAVVICNVGRFGSDEAALLADYVVDGGTAIFFLGDQVQADNYNDVLGFGSKKRILSAELIGPSKRGNYQFDPLNFRHPMMAPFRGQQDVGLESTPVSKYMRLRVKAGSESAAKTVLGFDSQDPAIVEESIGNGRCIVFATSASDKSLDDSVSPPRPWTYFSLWRSFVPLVHESVRLGLSRSAERKNIFVGDELRASLVGGSAKATLEVVRPDKRSQRVAVDAGGPRLRFQLDDTSLSGFYHVRFNETDAPSYWFAVNVNTRESALKRIAAGGLPAQFEQTLKINEDNANNPIPAGAPYFRYILGLLLVLLLVETCLAWYLGVR